MTINIAALLCLFGCRPDVPVSGERYVLPRCGDGVVEAGEVCDDGNTTDGDGCNSTCISDESCGNGVVDTGAGEQCDDGNLDAGDGCAPSCMVEYCGNGVVDPGEACDDGNTLAGDGCSSDCRSDESCGNGVVDVAVGEACDDGNTTDGDGCQSTCAWPTCGDDQVDAGEVCDDGNNVSGDGCNRSCTSDESCGNSVVDTAAGEQCDDGNDTAGDGCSPKCMLEYCGNETVDPGEVCDDGNTVAGDGCSRGCQSDESCGNGVVDSAVGEVCDDGNNIDGDGCSADCLADRMVVAGWQHTCALLETGIVRCWGLGDSGQLGYDNTDTLGDDEDPASAGDVNVGGTVTQLAAGMWHTCALLAGGTVRCWGDNTYGQLGYGNTDNIGDNEAPASAGDVDVGGTVTQIAAGWYHTCAVLAGGAVRCWGLGDSGQLGYGNTANIGDSEAPASAGDVNVGGTVTQIAAGGEHICALLDSGAVRCWGLGDSGRLGHGNTDSIGDDEAPASAGDVSVGSTAIQLAAGGEHTCALLDSGAVRCWGYGDYGQLGHGNQDEIGDDEAPASAGDVSVGGPVIQLAAGSLYTCALLDTQAVRCWGDGRNGRLGYGNTDWIGDDEIPASAGDVSVGGAVSQIAAGGGHTCALLNGGAVRCWGYGDSGRLGYGNTDWIGDDETPASAGDVPYR